MNASVLSVCCLVKRAQWIMVSCWRTFWLNFYYNAALESCDIAYVIRKIRGHHYMIAV